MRGHSIFFFVLCRAGGGDWALEFHWLPDRSPYHIPPVRSIQYLASLSIRFGFRFESLVKRKACSVPRKQKVLSPEGTLFFSLHFSCFGDLRLTPECF